MADWLNGCSPIGLCQQETVLLYADCLSRIRFIQSTSQPFQLLGAFVDRGRVGGLHAFLDLNLPLLLQISRFPLASRQ